MKRLIIIMLLCLVSQGWGQDKEITKETTLIYDSKIYIYEKDKSDSIKADEYLLKGLIHLLEEFEKTCIDTVYWHKFITTTQQLDSTLYIYNKTSSLFNFLQFLKKKVK